MAKKSVAIVGYGVVGKSMHTVFGEDAVCLDVNATNEDRNRVNACEAAFVSVPTPVDAQGRCDTSIVESVVAWLKTPLIVIRSTIAPGTTDCFRSKYKKRIIFQPEYIGETPNHPLADARKHAFLILGGPFEDCSAVAEIYKRYYHSEVRFYFTSSTCAEVAKYMENSFFAIKVIFCNEFYEIAKAHGVDYNELREIWLADPRMGRDHTFVYPDNRGFSGKCLPKDVSAIIESTRNHGARAEMLEAIMAINEAYRVNDPTYAPYRKATRNAK